MTDKEASGDMGVDSGLKNGDGGRTPADWRLLSEGWEIPSEGYCDQPYVVKNEDGSWTCVMTTGSGREGESGQHVISILSKDRGRSWSEPVDVEPADGPEASYAVPLKVPSGRIYCFYNHNTDNIRRVKADDPPYRDGWCRRVDSLGYFVFKYSDDCGRSWSDRRYTIPVREMEIDRQNPYGGDIRFFWNVGRAFIHEGAVCVSLHKIGRFGRGFMAQSEGVLLKSGDLLSVEDPEDALWETLPRGEKGLCTPPGGGSVSDEHNFVILSDGSLYCTYRSTDGHPVYALSRDGGETFSEPRYLRYADGRPVRHPRAANFVWKCANGKYLYWFHNHGGRDYEDRNPAWVLGGVEFDTPVGRDIKWSQPEILLYDDDPYIRMSYPDLIEDGGEYFLTETQKDTARIHRLDRSLLCGLWGQFEHREGVDGEGLLFERDLSGRALPAVADAPDLPRFVGRDPERLDHGTRQLRTGFTLEVVLELESRDAGQILIDSLGEEGGLRLQLGEGGCLRFDIGDGRTLNSWFSDPGLLEEGREHHIGIVVDGGPCIIAFIVDGRFCDGGDQRQFGWGRFSPHLRHARGEDELALGPCFSGRLGVVRIYGRALRTSELIGNYRSCR